MLRWFRRKPKEHPLPADEQAAPTSPVETPAADAAADTQPTASTAARRRKRGSRGGRGRRKPGERAEEKAPEKEAKAEKKPERKPRESRSRQSRRRTATPRSVPPPAKRDLVVSVDVAEQRVAILEDDKVAEVYLERPESRSIAGNIYKGTVDNVLPGMEAAFVEIGLEKNGFLYVDEIVTPELEGRRHGRKIQDLLSRGEEILVQAVKDPMKSKGARLTTEISLPGRFVVYVPSGEGFGVSRRLPEEERARLRDILKSVAPKTGSMIVRTAAEGASPEDIERDIDFLQRLWKEIQKRAGQAKAPALVYQEAELPLRVVRDLFTNDFEQAVVDHDVTYKRIVGYLKKTSPHMAEKVRKHTGKISLFEDFGVEEEIRSTLSRRVDLPSGGYLVFDYAEAFTVIDVNTGRFVGSRSKSSASRLEDTITKNNLEAVKEVVRQLRLRDIGGIIVIDFIDMANPK
ncbi:MAG TPA: Rne/Rng family ribonuclease, partial [Gaiellaceae bacterium]|nr:Rne/Rng family ribonuclease [Gaiellaceae bacterium]